MAASEQLKALVNQMPDPDERKMFTKNIDKDKISQAISQIQKGGRANVLGLIDLLARPGSPENVKAHYALHCLGNQTLVDRNESARRQFSETLAKELVSNRPAHVKAFLCQELQWAGHKEATPALGKLLLDDYLVERAAMALVAIDDGAAEQFRAALPKATGKCRLNILQGLGAVKDRASAAALRSALTDSDREIRLAAGWGLASIGDADSASLLVKAADAHPGWERIQATKHCLVLAENLTAAGSKKQAAAICQHLVKTRTDPSEAYIRQAAKRGLEGGG